MAVSSKSDFDLKIGVGNQLSASAGVLDASLAVREPLELSTGHAEMKRSARLEAKKLPFPIPSAHVNIIFISYHCFNI